MGVLIIRIIIYWGLYWVPLTFGKTYMGNGLPFKIFSVATTDFLQASTGDTRLLAKLSIRCQFPRNRPRKLWGLQGP